MSTVRATLHRSWSVRAQLPWAVGVHVPGVANARHASSVVAEPSEHEPPAVKRQSSVLSGQTVAP